MKKQIMLLILAVSLISTAEAQSYFTAAGIRVGTDWGLTLQQRISKRMTVEGIIQSSFGKEQYLVTGLVERHFPLITRHFNIYGGMGLHKGWLAAPESEGVQPTDPFGLSFVGGAELSLGRFNVSYDFKPALNLSGGEKTVYTQSAVSVRYILIKDKAFKKMERKKKKKKKQKAKAKKQKAKSKS